MYHVNKRGKEEEVEPWISARGLSAATSVGLCYDDDENEHIKEMDKYKVQHHRSIPALHECLYVLKKLGYHKGKKRGK